MVFAIHHQRVLSPNRTQIPNCRMDIKIGARSNRASGYFSHNTFFFFFETVLPPPAPLLKGNVVEGRRRFRRRPHRREEAARAARPWAGCLCRSKAQPTSAVQHPPLPLRRQARVRQGSGRGVHDSMPYSAAPGEVSMAVWHSSGKGMRIAKRLLLLLIWIQIYQALRSV